MKIQDFAIHAISVPFKDKGRDMEGFDCWGLVCCCYKKVLGIDLPLLTDEYKDSGLSESSRFQIGELINREKIQWLKIDWIKVTEYNPMDVVLFTLGGQLVHCGVMVNAKSFLHTEKKVGTCIERLSSPLWQRRIDGVYRMVPILCPTK